MRENRRTYRITAASVQEINFVLAQIADRMDQVEGFRGTPSFKAAPNMGGNAVRNVGSPSVATDAAILGNVDYVDAELGSVQAGYLNKAGVAGGQVAYGGTGSGDNLSLKSTTHSSKGWVGYIDATGTVLHGWYG